MQLEFTINSISGKEMSQHFCSSIEKESIGWEMLDKKRVQAELYDDPSGTMIWKTATSDFRYIIMNPDDDDQPVRILYDGAVRGFRQQKLIPEKLKTPTSHATVRSGSIFARGMFDFEDRDADVLASAYSIIQKTDHPITNTIHGLTIAKTLVVMQSTVCRDQFRHITLTAALDFRANPALVIACNATGTSISIVPAIGYGDPEASDAELIGASVADLISRTTDAMNRIADA